MQPNKNIKIFINYFLGPILFAWLLFSIYHQLKAQPALATSWKQITASLQSYKVIYLLLAVLLIPANWGIEAWKWKLSMKPVFPITYAQACKAILSGVSFSVTMPNRVGEYFGRMMFLPEGNRLKTISVTLVGSFAQLLVTLVAGIAGLAYLKTDLLRAFPNFTIWYQFAMYGLIVLVFLMLLIYFNVDGTVTIFRRWLKAEKQVYLVEALQNFGSRRLLQVLALSTLRYFVFMLQYIFVFYVFEVHVAPVIIVFVMSLIFLAMAVIPSISLLEVGLRGEISIRLMGIYTANTLGAGLTSLTLWFINLIIPAIAGSLLILGVRFFKKNSKQP